MKGLALLLGMILAAGVPPWGQESDSADLGLPSGFGDLATHLRSSAVTSHTAVVAGKEFHVAVEIQIDDGWVYYSPRPGEIAKPASVTVQAETLAVGDILWSPDCRYQTDLGDETIVNHVYRKRAVIYVPLTVPAKAEPGERAITITIRGQICGEVCADIESVAAATVTVARSSLADDAWTRELSDGLKNAVPAAKLPSIRGPGQPAEKSEAVTPSGAAGVTIWSGLGLALLAGLILNVMPCVLPVIPLRVLSLAQMAGQQRQRFITLGLAFAGGIMLFFVGLAAASVVIGLATHQTLNLNIHFQYRPVRIGLALVLVALAANLFGLFNVTVPPRLAGLGQGKPKRGHQGHVAAVGMGAMMAILATPCSFAVLAGALAWAQTQPLWLGALAIIFIGLGMAAPHAALVAFPKLVNKLPKPGRWMELLKQSAGFLLLPVAVWLIFAGSKDTYPGWVIAYALVLAMCLWLWGTWVRYDAPLRRKLIVRGLAVAVAVAAGVWMLSPPRPLAVKLEDFNMARIDEAHRNHRIVLIKFTSATCLSCLWLDRTVYDDPEVASELGRRNIVTMKADTTDAETPASRMLKERFQGAPPLTVLLAPDGQKPIFLRGKFTKTELLRALERLLDP